jgi:hypothetical protein
MIASTFGSAREWRRAFLVVPLLCGFMCWIYSVIRHRFHTSILLINILGTFFLLCANYLLWLYVCAGA